MVERLWHNGSSEDPDQPFRLENGHFVGITKNFGITVYRRTKLVPANMVNTRNWGGTTTPIVALFLDEDEARSCLVSPVRHRWDIRWLEQTQQVLERIGHDHPMFTPDEELLSLDKQVIHQSAHLDGIGIDN